MKTESRHLSSVDGKNKICPAIPIRHTWQVAGEATFIYAIECQGIFKVGIAANLQWRLDELKTGNPFPMRVAYYHRVPKARAHLIERWIHEQMAETRVHGEWFRSPRQRVYALIDKATAPRNPLFCHV